MSGLLIGRFARRPHLPDRVMPVGVAARAAEQIPIERAAHVGGDGVAEFLRVERDGMVLVNRFAIEHRLDRRAVVIVARAVVAAGELGDVAVLAHVEVEPVVIVKPLSMNRCRRGGWNVIR